MKEHRQISSEELEFLFRFCKKKGIEFVDLRLELVDHLASQVEAIWQEEPRLSFKTAFHKLYKAYGSFGFQKLAQEHSRLVWKKYGNICKQEFIYWLKPPQILLTLIIGFLCYLSLITFSFFGFYLWSAIYLAHIITLIYMVLKSRSIAKDIKKERTMLLSSPRQFWWIFYFASTLPLQTDPFSFNYHQPSVALFSTIFFLVSLLFILANNKILRLAEQQVSAIKERLNFYHL